MNRLPLFALLLPGLVACGGEDTVGTSSSALCSASGRSLGAVVTFATFARTVDDATAEGIDLDGIVSEGGGRTGCGKADFVGPAGDAGIDNQFATLLPLIEEFVGTENIDALLEGAIANGQLLIVMEVTGVDDPYNDDCVDVAFGAGQGTPLLNTEGDYEPYQSFGFDTSEIQVSRLPGGRIVNGVLEAGPAQSVLPVRILDADFNLALSNTRAKMNVTYDPVDGGISLDGYMGGGVNVDQFKDIVSGLTVGSDLVEAVTPVVGFYADLVENDEGVCQDVSANLRFGTVPAFVIGDGSVLGGD